MSARRGWRNSAALIAAGVFGLLLLAGCGGETAATPAQTPPPPARSERDRAIEAAETLYAEKKKEGLDFSSGPCLSNEVIPGWAEDIAHNPRQPVDDLSQNQCSSYREGKVQHFVELDPDGNLIRAQ